MNQGAALRRKGPLEKSAAALPAAAGGTRNQISMTQKNQERKESGDPEVPGMEMIRHNFIARIRRADGVLRRQDGVPRRSGVPGRSEHPMRRRPLLSETGGPRGRGTVRV